MEMTELEGRALEPFYYGQEERIDLFMLETRHMEDMQLFKTTNGRIGYTRVGVKAGDMLCLFDSSPVFHVLRRAEDRTEGEFDNRYETYRLMGDAYVHGLMYGEAEDMDLEERYIVLV